MHFLRCLLPVVMLLSACERPADTPTVTRAVRTVTLAPTAMALRLELPGDVRARIEASPGFEVGGRLIERPVDLGSRVRKGQMLARIDPRELGLARDASLARLTAAKAEANLARSDYDRHQDLHRQGFISASALENRATALEAAQSRVGEAEAAFELQKNRGDDARLLADADGIITAVWVDVGEVVSPGQPVVRIAHDGEREVEVMFAEDKLAMARTGTAEVALWAHPGQRFPATLRELAAAADPMTRTFRARFRVDAPPEALALGQTAVLRLSLPSRNALTLPTTALWEDQGETRVWRHDPDTSTVHARTVQIVGVDGNDVAVHGLMAGDTIVTAGVHALTEGQAVRRMTATPSDASSDAR